MRSDTPARGFETAEFQARLARAQARMAADDLAGILVLSEPEVRYFTGFQTLFWQSPTRPWFVFLPATGAPVAIIPEIGAELMGRSWVQDIRTWSAPCPNDDGISLLTDLLAPLAASGARIGLPMGHETKLYMPLADWMRLTDALPGLQVVDATAITQGLRMVKSDAEIAKIAHICAIGSATFDRVPEFAQPGLPFVEVFRAFRREALAQGADDAPYVVGGAAPGGYADVISPPNERPLARGDVMMLDTGLVWDGYYCDFDRTWAIGAARDEAMRAYDVLWRATEAGLKAARPGNTCRDLFAAMASVIAELDDSGGDIGRLGHGLGMQLTEQPSHAAFDTTELCAGMVLTLEPSLSFGQGKMMVHEENIVIREGGAELLTKRAAPALPVT